MFHRTVTVAFVAAILPLVASAPAHAGSGALAGTWTSVDSGDGSSQSLLVRGEGTRAYAVTYADESASVCGGPPAVVAGPGSFDGTRLEMVGVLTCRPGGNIFRERITLGFTYMAGSDTLVDDAGDVWTRS